MKTNKQIMKEYNGVPLNKEDFEVITSLEKRIDEKIPITETKNYINSL